MRVHRMQTERTARLWRWGIGLTIIAALLGAWWLALDRFATRIGLDAENTLRERPREADIHHRSD